MKSLGIFLLFLFCLFALPPRALAHMLTVDGSVGAVLHIDPEDDPIVGQPSGFFFEFKDKLNRFTPQQCDCTFSILQAGKTIHTQPLFQSDIAPNLAHASVIYTFTQKDVYTVQITGKPLVPEAFAPFTLSYTIRVARQPPGPGTNKPMPSAFLLIGAVVVSLVILMIAYRSIQSGFKRR